MMKKSDHYKTVLTIVTGLLVLVLITNTDIKLNTFSGKIFIVSITLSILSLISAFIANKVDFLWMKLAYFLGKIGPNIILSLVFYLFLTPISLLKKLFDKNDLLKLKNRNESTFLIVNKKFDSKSLENMW
jgi:hypothetical protein